MINKDEINFDGFDFKLKMLFWKTCTASEKNNDFFTLERSKDGTSFEKLKTVSGAGNSDHVLNYSEKDEAPLHGISYYRLKQMDYDGKTSYSRVVTVEFNSNSQIKVQYNAAENNETKRDLLSYTISWISSLPKTTPYSFAY